MLAFILFLSAVDGAAVSETPFMHDANLRCLVNNCCYLSIYGWHPRTTLPPSHGSDISFVFCNATFFFFLPSFKKIISGHAFYRICLLAVLLGRSQANLRKIKMFCFQTPVACKIYLIWLGWFHLILQSGGLSVHTFWMHWNWSDLLLFTACNYPSKGSVLQILDPALHIMHIFLDPLYQVRATLTFWRKWLVAKTSAVI